MESTKVNLNLELELADGRLSGLATESGGDRRSFTGWLGMIGAIDAILGEDAAAPTGNPNGEDRTDVR